MNQIIGILGGMGPRATVQFEQMLLDRLSGTDQQLPTIIAINDGGIADRTSFLLGRGPDPVPRMQRNLTALENMGATIICLPCNTACAPDIFDRLAAKESLLLNLPDIVSGSLSAQPLQSLMVLATEGTIVSRVYGDVCASNGINYLEPDKLTQRRVNAVIRLVKQGDVKRAERLSLRLRQTIIDSGADAVLLGCTELPLVTHSLVPRSCVPIDTLSLLADACVHEMQVTRSVL